ncbi:MAG TPA: universal stress protein [Planctomycetaceae bacterium]|nr:universal stress protein [Planctomycetaceae bacterium]HIQ20885.1 universal stress protein [Planctomycetota bacterium]
MPHWLPRKTVVVPIDFSEDSFAVLDTALELVDSPAHLHVIHVLPVLEPTEPGVIWQTIDDRGRSEHAEEALRAELAKRNHPDVQVVIRFGDPGHEIAHYADQVEAGLVVVASHGRTGLKRLLIGSVADRVVRLAHCPVLVLKR